MAAARSEGVPVRWPNMIAKGLPLDWTVVLTCVIVAASVWAAYRVGHYDGWHAGRRDLIRRQERERRARANDTT